MKDERQETATDREKILALLRRTGHALATGDVARRIRPRVATYQAMKTLRRMEDDGLVDSRPSGCGYRWWAIAESDDGRARL